MAFESPLALYSAALDSSLNLRSLGHFLRPEVITQLPWGGLRSVAFVRGPARGGHAGRWYMGLSELLSTFKILQGFIL